MKTKLMSLLLSVGLLLSVAAPAFAADIDNSSFAVVAKNGFAVAEEGVRSTVSIKGSVLALGGDIILKDRNCLSGDNKIYYKEGASITAYDIGVGVTDPSRYCVLTDQDYTFTKPEKPAFDTASLMALEDIVVGKEDVVISQDITVENVQLTGTGNLVFDVPEGNTLYAEIGTVDFSGTGDYNKGAVMVTGGGTVCLKAGTVTGEKAKNFNYPSRVNVGWETYQYKTGNKLVLLLENQQELAQFRMEGDLYLSNSLNIAGTFNVVGNLVADQDVIYQGEISAKTEEFNVLGQVYAEDGLVHLVGAARVRGQLIADRAELFGNSTVVYQDMEYIPVTPGTPAPTAEPTPVPTTEPTAVPTIEPTGTPDTDLIPDNPVTTKPIEATTNYAYIYGYTQSIMAPDAPVTRGEAAAMVNRVLYQENMRHGFTKPSTPTFRDLGEGDWRYSALEYMTSLGVYNSNAGLISPNQDASRAEIAKMISFVLGLQPSGTDLGYDDMKPGDKYYQFMDAMVTAGYLEGNDNLLRPGDTMTRAEFVTMFNRIIGRSADNGFHLEYSDGTPVTVTFTDIDSHWAYEELIYGTNSFDSNGYVDPSLKTDRNQLDFEL